MELDTGETDVFLGQCMMLWEHAAGSLPSLLARQDLGIQEGSLEGGKSRGMMQATSMCVCETSVGG